MRLCGSRDLTVSMMLTDGKGLARWNPLASSTGGLQQYDTFAFEDASPIYYAVARPVSGHNTRVIMGGHCAERLNVKDTTDFQPSCKALCRPAACRFELNIRIHMPAGAASTHHCCMTKLKTTYI